MAASIGWSIVLIVVGVDAIAPSHAMHVRCQLASPTPRRSAVIAAKADFSGEWEMDLGASDALGPTLRTLGINRVLAALIARLSVKQSITQDDDALRIMVKTSISESEIALRFDGTTTRTPGIGGGMTATVSRWLDDEQLETRQALSEDDGPPDEATGDAFVTVRSLLEGGSMLQEDVTVVRQGRAVPGASAKRRLRRLG